MWLNFLPEPLRKLLAVPQQYRSPVKHAGEWKLYILAYRLGLTLDKAYQLMDAGPLPRRFRYRHFSVPKRTGGSREIVEPGPDLKMIQHKILTLFLNKLHPHSAALGFRRKKSIADHAWAHAGAGIIITADIQDFFPSTSRQRIKGWWHDQGFTTLEVRLLTALTTYRGSLPQGAPTSPALSNLVNAEMDAALQRRTNAAGGTYTRYADDMAFSWPGGYSPPADFEIAVRGILRSYGYNLHPDKGWHIWRRQDQPEITGLILTRRGAVDIPESMLRIMRVLSAADTDHDLQRLAGYEGYRAMVTRPRVAKPKAAKSR